MLFFCIQIINGRGKREEGRGLLLLIEYEVQPLLAVEVEFTI
jgi:hypothetical protein